MHTTRKRITRWKQNSLTLQTKFQRAANERIIRCKQNSRTLQTKPKVLRAQDDVKDWDLVSWFSWFTTNMPEFLRREIHAGVTKTQTPRTFFKKGLVNSSQFLSPNVLWSCNVHRQQPERSKIFTFSGLSLLHRSNSEKLITRFNNSSLYFDRICWGIFYRRNRRHRVA